jgi:hypothetical protein
VVLAVDGGQVLKIFTTVFVLKGDVCKNDLVVRLYLTKPTVFYVCEHFSFLLLPASQLFLLNSFLLVISLHSRNTSHIISKNVILTYVDKLK